MADRRQARAIATRDTILAAAGCVFSRSSYSSAPLSEILSTAGVTQGALYFHFPSKHALAQAVIDRQHELSLAIASPEAIGALSGWEAIVAVTADLAGLIMDDPVVRGGLRLSTESAEVFAGDGSKPYHDWIDLVEVLFERAIAEGDVTPDLSPAVYSNVVVAAFTGTQIVARVLVDGEPDLRDRLAMLWRVLLPGLVPAERRAVASEVVERRLGRRG